MSAVKSPAEILAELDDSQQLAVTSLKGPVAIIAGAGSGKTRTISHRIAYGIATGSYTESRLLALTYTNRAAAELRTRLRQLGAPSVAVRTFHSAALAQLQFFWPQLTESISPKLVTQKSPMLAEVLSGMNIRVSEQERFALQSEIEFLRYAMLEVSDYPNLDRPKLALNAERFVEFFKAYELFKQQRRVVDWEDAILLTTGMLRNETRMLSHVQQQYRFLPWMSTKTSPHFSRLFWRLGLESAMSSALLGIQGKPSYRLYRCVERIPARFCRSLSSRQRD
jgi:Superfamily I DNA and RNA helicases